ncbi:MAG: hypothetical protein WD512_02450 [Candidatus Paceibacterota bacterium]
MRFLDRLNFQNGITDQRVDTPYIVLYTASAKDANAVMLNRKDIDLNFIVDYTSYFYILENREEAFYITTFLNSNFPNKAMKPFQAKGTFGARHVSKKILEIPFPKFDKKNKQHLELAKLGEAAHQKAQAYAEKKGFESLSPYHLGRARLDIKEHLKKEMKEIDNLVKELIEGV